MLEGISCLLVLVSMAHHTTMRLVVSIYSGVNHLMPSMSLIENRDSDMIVKVNPFIFISFFDHKSWRGAVVEQQCL